MPLSFRSSLGTSHPSLIPFQSHPLLQRSRVQDSRSAGPPRTEHSLATALITRHPGNDTVTICLWGYMSRHQCHCTDQMDHILFPDLLYPWSRDGPHPPQQNTLSLNNGTKVFSLSSPSFSLLPPPSLLLTPCSLSWAFAALICLPTLFSRKPVWVSGHRSRQDRQPPHPAERSLP